MPITNTKSAKDIVPQCILLLKQLLNNNPTRARFAKSGSIGSLMDSGRIDQPMKPLTMNIMRVMQEMRTKLAGGGLVDDESQTLYLISVLEGGHLNPLEQELLLELYEDLKKIQGGNQ